MVHELLGLNNNRVVLKGAPGISKELEEVVLCSSDDNFFSSNRNSNYGDLATAVKVLIDQYARSKKLNENVQSIEDMQRLLDRYPALRSQSHLVSKHVAILTELNRLVDVCKLLDISQLEQEISCTADHGGHLRELMEKLGSQSVKSPDKLRLALLYITRYESYNEIGQIKQKLSEQRVQGIALIDSFLDYCGEAKRAPGLFNSGGLMSALTKTFASGLNGIENVYTQHQPLFCSILDAFAKQKIKDSAFPLVNAGGSSRPTELFIFMIGGATFEESFRVSEFNLANPSLRVVLGGSCVHNSASFLKEIGKMFG